MQRTLPLLKALLELIFGNNQESKRIDSHWYSGWFYRVIVMMGVKTTLQKFMAPFGVIIFFR